jgi:hypothetical protein
MHLSMQRPGLSLHFEKEEDVAPLVRAIHDACLSARESLDPVRFVHLSARWSVSQSGPTVMKGRPRETEGEGGGCDGGEAEAI